MGGILHYAGEELRLPWQRVINRHGFISTKCLDHPRELQKVILESEGIEVSADFIVDLEKYGWWGEKG